jgi:AcrR family transcriptional regulator
LESSPRLRHAYHLSPRTYKMAQRQAAADKTRERILHAARQVLLAEDFSKFTMEAVARKADVSRLTVYYQFKSKARLLEALYDYIARRGHMGRLAQVFARGGDLQETLRGFIEVFVGFWASDRDVIRRLHGIGAIDREIGNGLLARNERRRHGLSVIVDRYGSRSRLSSRAKRAMVIDILHMLTSFESFDDLAKRRSADEVIEIIAKLAGRVLSFAEKSARPR